jgi:hypothetical protein
MNNYKSLKKYFIKLSKKYPVLKIFVFIIILILIFDKLFMLIVLTIIAKFNPKVDSFLKNKINSFPFLQKQTGSIL